MTKQEAMDLFETKFWETQSPKEIVAFQLFEDKLCMPFGVFHEATEKCLERPVFTHEFASMDLLRDEFNGITVKPSLTDIIDLIPKKKLIVVGI